MISRIEVRSGFPLALPMFERPISFTPGLNVLFGPNGCGKTTALNIAKAYSGVGESGWSTAPDPLDVRGKGRYPGCFAGWCVGKTAADVIWDGSPSYFASSIGEVVVPHAFDDGDMLAQLQIMYARPSAGQLRLHNLGRLVAALEKPPDLTVADVKGVNTTWQEARQRFADYVKTLPRTGSVTLLLDEPDRGLSIPVQADFWLTAVPQWATKVQVIVAAHSPFCLLAPGANIIDCVPGYRDDCLAALKAFAT